MHVLQRTWWWLAIFVGSVSLDLYFFLQMLPPHNTFLLLWLEWGSSVLTSAVYTVIGMFVCGFGKQNRVVTLFCWYCGTSLVTFAFLPAGAQDNLVGSAMGLIFSALTLLALNLLLLLFPLGGVERPLKRWQQLWLLVQGATCSMVIASALPLYLHPMAGWKWLQQLDDTIALLAIFGIFFLVLRLIRKTTVEKNSLYTLWWSLFIAISPFILLTLFPQVIHVSNMLHIDGEFSALGFIVLPYALAYVLLRHQFLVIPPASRAGVSQTLMQLGSVLILYPILSITTLLIKPVVASFLTVTIVSLLSMRYWRLGQMLIEKHCFGSFWHYRLAVQTFRQQAFKAEELNALAILVIETLQNVTQATTVSLFLLDEGTGLFRLLPTEKLSSSDIRLETLQILFHTIPPLRSLPELGIVEWISKSDEVILNFDTGQPQLLSMLKNNQADEQYVTQTKEILLLPLRSANVLPIGIAVIRSGHHILFENGIIDPEFSENLLYLATQLAPALDRVRVQQKQTDLIWIKWLLESKPVAGTTVEHLLYEYGKHVALLLSVGTQVWSFNSVTQQLIWTANIGSVTPLIPQDSPISPSTQDWNPHFFAGMAGTEEEVPPVLRPFLPSHPLAWLPITAPGGDHLGILLATYTQAHVFSSDEQAVLVALINQCVQNGIYLRGQQRLEQQLAHLDQHFALWQTQHRKGMREAFLISASLEGCLKLLQDDPRYEAPELRDGMMVEIKETYLDLLEQITRLHASSAQIMQISDE